MHLRLSGGRRRFALTPPDPFQSEIDLRQKKGGHKATRNSRHAALWMLERRKSRTEGSKWKKNAASKGFLSKPFTKLKLNRVKASACQAFHGILAFSL